MNRILGYCVVMLLFIGNISAQLRINEINVSNLTGATDYYGQKSDWVELYNAGTLPISLNGYYLSNSPSNLYMYALPNISIKPDSFLIVWLTGRNIKAPNGEYHANFTIEQCKNQWIILSLAGVVKDSLKIRKTMADHSRGKYPDGSLGWKLFTTPTFSAPNSSTYFVDYAPTPTFTPAAGFSNPGQVDITVYDTTLFKILFTQDGSDPKPGVAPNYTIGLGGSTQVYDPIATPLNPGVTTVYRAICVPVNSYSTAYLPSFIETNTYFIGETIDPNFGVVSIAMDTGTASFFNTAISQTIHIEYFDKQKQISEGYTTINKPINDGWITKQKGVDFIFKDEYGNGCALQGQVFNNANLGISTRTFFPAIEMKCETKDNFSSYTTMTNTPMGAHMRDMFAQTYAIKSNLNLDAMHFKPVVAFVNGKYYGIYELSELPDKFYAEFYKNIKRDSVDILAQHLTSYVLSGSDTGWVTPSGNNRGVTNYINYYTMVSSAPFYKNVTSRLDTNSLIDFMIYNNVLVNIDLMNENNAWWRGRSGNNVNLTKWRYFTWNMPNIYGLCMGPSTFTNCSMAVSGCPYNPYYNASSPAYELHSYLLTKLMTNTGFKNTYLARYMDLLNTALKCENLLAHANYIKNLLSTEMNNHCSNAWNVNYSDWQANVDTFLTRIQSRCDTIHNRFKSCYNLNGPHFITVDVYPPGAGYVYVNTILVKNFTWTGTYYTLPYPNSLTLNFKAIPADTNYVFDHWENQNTSVHTLKQNIRDTAVSLSLKANDKITAYFYDKRTDALFPTGFTPNGDNINDEFGPVNPRFLKNYELHIYNRWGEEIFSTTNPFEYWDGTYKGKEVEPGVYAYVARYKNILNEEKVTKGNITLIR
jgi:gliding motility-associated-like protein